MAGTALRAASNRQLLDVGVPVVLAVLAVTQLVADEPPGNAALVTLGALATVVPPRFAPGSRWP